MCGEEKESWSGREGGPGARVGAFKVRRICQQYLRTDDGISSLAHITAPKEILNCTGLVNPFFKYPHFPFTHLMMPEEVLPNCVGVVRRVCRDHSIASRACIAAQPFVVQHLWGD